MAYYKYNKQAQSEATPNQFQPFLQNIPKGKDGKEKYYNIPSDKSSDDNKFRILPPWSEEGLFAKVKKIHSYIGVNSVSLVCPDTEEEGTCPFCQVAAKIRNEEKFKVDYDAVKDKIRAVFNVEDSKNPSLGALVFSTYSRIYFTIKKFQDSGEYGDITDPIEGRDIRVSRTVHGKGKFEDATYPGPNSTKLQNPDSLDGIVDLDTVFPPVDMEAVNKAFRSHPWKVYTPQTSVSVPSNFKQPESKKEETITHSEEAKPVQEATPTASKESKVDELERKLREKMEKNKKA